MQIYEFMEVSSKKSLGARYLATGLESQQVIPDWVAHMKL
jgi:hypothetical protein